ncbi:MAG: hypothetical protein OJF51_004104 [Nitrospira sp.]|nr:MAG: hypothetical protein OJF51_004104 [Nitrospira sp.]
MGTLEKSSNDLRTDDVNITLGDNSSHFLGQQFSLSRLIGT